MIDVLVASRMPAEVMAAERLATSLGRFDLSRWEYAPAVRIDGGAVSPASHPTLVLPPSAVSGDEDAVVSLYLHEQMHWASETLPRTLDAIAEVRLRFPDPPPRPAAGRDPESTWLHFPVCSLHLDALCDVFGPARGRKLFASTGLYPWIHEQLLRDDQWRRDFVSRHRLVLPSSPPARHRPRTATSLNCGPLAVMCTGDALEALVVATLVRLHCDFDLAAFAFSDEVRVDNRPRPPLPATRPEFRATATLRQARPVPRLGTRRGDDADVVLARYLEAQHAWQQARSEAHALDDDLEAIVRQHFPIRAAVTARRTIVSACAATWSALTPLIGTSRSEVAVADHPLNAALYEAIAAARPETDQDAWGGTGARL